MMDLELVPLCEVVMKVGDSQQLGRTPTGDMMIGEIVSARWEGERLRASLRGHTAADWMTFAPDGTGLPDVRMTLETDDGALIYVAYSGRFSSDTGIAYTTPCFRTGDAGYAWLNHVQAVGKATFDATTGTIHYPMIYELR